MTDAKVFEMQATDWPALFNVATEDCEIVLRCRSCTWVHVFEDEDSAVAEWPTLSDLRFTAHIHYYATHVEVGT